MDGQKDRLEGDRKHIWLRYATEFTSGGRKHTIEMGVPMPLGASDEERERLLNEAEQGMHQLIGRVEKRASQAFQRAQNSVATGTTQGQQGAPRPAQLPQKPASLPAPQTSTQPSPPLKTPQQVRENAVPQTQAEEVQVPPSRPSIGPLPSTPTATGELDSGDMHLSAFLHYIKETWGIEPREAMQYLNVRSLSTINRRAAVARLHELLDKGDKEGPRTSNQATKRSTPPTPRSSNRPYTAPSADTQPPQIQNRTQTARIEGKMPPAAPTASVSKDAVADQPTRPVVAAPAMRDLPVEPESSNGHSNGSRLAEVTPEVHARPVRAFEEEDGPEDLEGLADLDEGDIDGMTPAIIHVAQDKLHQLREIKGPTAVREHRLKVLGNVIGDQISTEELQKLIEGVWGVSSLKKLKLDQNEALITWAKEDNFVPEAKAVLHLLEEEQ